MAALPEIAWEDAPRPDAAFQQTWGECLSEITNWADWRLAPEVLTMTEANAWSIKVRSRETIHLSSGQTLVRRPGQPPASGFVMRR